MHTQNEISAVLALIEQGLNDCQIARTTGIARRTILDWRHGRVPGQNAETRRRGLTRSCEVCAGRPLGLPASAYSYVLGLYLGDGCISRSGRTHKLRITLDASYPMIISECIAALEAIRPGKRAWSGKRRDSRCVEVCMYWNHWPCLLPQHGRGKKHERKIALAPWQDELVAEERRSLIRGLIHSDGCRVVASDRGVRSVRYHFSNRSEDIKAIYCESFDALDIPWTRPCGRQIAVYRQSAVAILDSFVGAKR